MAEGNADREQQMTIGAKGAFLPDVEKSKFVIIDDPVAELSRGYGISHRLLCF
jgi:hypothetical protein